ncbi:MAG: hypothetical protein AB1757_05005 [Acidobacteriota bacterium]
MFTFILSSLVSLFTGALLTYFLLRKRVGIPAEPLPRPRNLIKLVGVQIICGDCAGEDEAPLKTFLNAYDKCARCGGNSYVLASSFESTMMLYKALEFLESAMPTNDANVISIQEHIAARESQEQKIAV